MSRRRRGGGPGAAVATAMLGLVLVAAAAAGAYGFWLASPAAPEDYWLVTGFAALAVVGAVVGLALLSHGRRWTAAIVAVFAVAAAVALLVPQLQRGQPTERAMAPAPSKRSPLLLPEVETWEQGVVPLCWMAAPDPVADAVLIRAVDRAAAVWRAAGYVMFEDVGVCQAGFEGVRLHVTRDPSEDPDSDHVGAPVAGPAYDVTLKAGFRSRSGCLARPGATLEGCIFARAAHEFGHVLGLPDLELSDEAPAACQSRLGPHNTLDVPYDPASIMNACNDATYLGRLSKGDIGAIRQTYGPFIGPGAAEFTR